MHLPWVELTILIAAMVVFMLASVSVYRAVVADSHGESIVFFLSVSQSAGLILIFFLVVTFSRRDANVEQLHVLADEFLRKYVPRSLSRASIPALNITNFTVKDEGEKDIFGRLLRMTSGDYKFEMWVGLNVSRIFVIYFVPLQNGLESGQNSGLTKERAQKIFEFTFGGAQKVGFSSNFEEAVVNGQDILSIWLTVETSGELLTTPQDKLFWAQDIAMMTESFLRTANRNHIDLRLNGISPGPL